MESSFSLLFSDCAELTDLSGGEFVSGYCSHPEPCRNQEVMCDPPGGARLSSMQVSTTHCALLIMVVSFTEEVSNHLILKRLGLCTSFL